MITSFIITYLLFGFGWSVYAAYAGIMKEEDTLPLTIIEVVKHILFWFVMFSFMTFEKFLGKKK